MVKKSPIIIIGCGGHASSIIDLLSSNNSYDIVGLIGEKRDLGKDVLGFPVIGTDSDLEKIRITVPNAVVGIGQIKSSVIREKVFNQLEKYNFKIPQIISNYSYVSKYSSIGDGTTIGHNVVINAGVEIGKYCILNSQVIVEHDTKVDDFCHLSTGVIINGGVTVGSNSFVGSGTVIREGLTIPKSSIISAGKRIMAWPMKER